jgi:hypothetical protein
MDGATQSVDADHRLGGVRRGKRRRDEPVADALAGTFVLIAVMTSAADWVIIPPSFS